MSVGQSLFNRPAMMLSAVSKAAAGALRIAKPCLIQNEAAKVSSAFAINSKYAFRYLIL